MTELITLGVGALVGFVFGALHLPIPAPPTLAGVLGIIGIFVGFFIASKVIG